MSILIGADIVPTASNIELFKKGQIEDLIGKELLNIMQRADYRIFNLEVPLTDVADPIGKYGPNLCVPTLAAEGIRALGVDLLTLANNHIMDQNSQGLESTIRKLDEIGIAHIGAGVNLSEACDPVLFDIGGKKIGVYACAEHEFSIADDAHPGANPFDPLESLDHVESLKEKCDYEIVLYHGGKEHYRYPSPMLQKTCRKLVDKGADLVICQHSHCIGCEENWKSGKIIYGQGNFIFDYDEEEYERTSLLIEVADDFKINYFPIEKQGTVIRMAAEEKANEILQSFQTRSEEIKEPGFIKKKYNDFAKKYLPEYIRSLNGRNRPFLYKVFNKLLSGKPDQRRARSFLEKSGLRTLNYIECEAHRELLLTGLKNTDLMKK